MILSQESAAPAASSLDLGLVRKHAVPAPRYTSYPPANRFTDAVDHGALEDAIRDDNRPGAGPISLYFHLPFCESLCWYCGCNTIITRRHASAAEYIDDLEREIAMIARRVDRRRPVSQVHFGGGTPTFLSPEELARLGLAIHGSFFLSPGCEFGVEIDPRRLTEDHVEALRVIGANRASLGVQDTDPEVQLAIHRWQPKELNAQAVGWLRNKGFTSINVDLIYGLPRQTEATFARTIDDVLALGPDRLSVFGYAHVPWMKPAQRIFETRNQLPTPEQRLAMFAVAHAKLAAAGYVDIGLDHFARPDDELAVAQRNGTLHRNFQGYSTAADASLYGLGVSSISSTENTYRQSFKDRADWRRAIALDRLPVERGLVLTADDRRRRAVIMGIMCDRRIDFSALAAELGVDPAEAFAPEIASLSDLEADGLVARTGSGVSVTPRGVPFLRVIAARFDPTVVQGQGRHSQTV
jgi:oxygen-independent coproporphyrinogen-3 oxidase